MCSDKERQMRKDDSREGGKENWTHKWGVERNGDDEDRFDVMRDDFWGSLELVYKEILNTTRLGYQRYSSTLLTERD